MKTVRITINHKGCFTQMQKDFPNLRVLDVNLTEPEKIRGKLNLFQGYVSLRGCKENKEKFYEQCKDYQSNAIKFLTSEMITDFAAEPTIFRYEAIELATPCSLSLITSSELEYSWPFIIKVVDGSEEMLLQGTEESIKKFNTLFKEADTGEINIEDINEDEFKREKRAWEVDKEIVCGLHILRTLRNSLKSNVMEHSHALFIKDVFLNSDVEKGLREISESRNLSYGTGRQIVGKVKKEIEKTLQNVFQILFADLDNHIM